MITFSFPFLLCSVSGFSLFFLPSGLKKDFANFFCLLPFFEYSASSGKVKSGSGTSSTVGDDSLFSDRGARGTASDFKFLNVSSNRVLKLVILLKCALQNTTNQSKKKKEIKSHHNKTKKLARSNVPKHGNGKQFF